MTALIRFFQLFDSRKWLHKSELLQKLELSIYIKHSADMRETAWIVLFPPMKVKSHPMAHSTKLPNYHPFRKIQTKPGLCVQS
jgi:hypothetical protein